MIREARAKLECASNVGMDSKRIIQELDHKLKPWFQKVGEDEDRERLVQARERLKEQKKAIHKLDTQLTTETGRLAAHPAQTELKMIRECEDEMIKRSETNVSAAGRLQPSEMPANDALEPSSELRQQLLSALKQWSSPAFVPERDAEESKLAYFAYLKAKAETFSKPTLENPRSSGQPEIDLASVRAARLKRESELAPLQAKVEELAAKLRAAKAKQEALHSEIEVYQERTTADRQRASPPPQAAPPNEASGEDTGMELSASLIRAMRHGDPAEVVEAVCKNLEHGVWPCRKVIWHEGAWMDCFQLAEVLGASAEVMQELRRSLALEVDALAKMSPAGRQKAMNDESRAAIGDARVVLLCVDADLESNAATRVLLAEALRRRLDLIPLIFPGYDISDYAQWWPESMPELQSHALFVDCRREPLALDATVSNELLPQVHKFLEEWRGEAADNTAVQDVLPKVPCSECVDAGVPEPHLFDREATRELLVRWRRDCLRRNSANAALIPQDSGGDRELRVECNAGHRILASEVLSRAVIYDSLACPQCVRHCEVPPYCFKRSRCLLYFSEDNQGRVGSLECSRCLAAGRNPTIRVLDIVAPEVFVSYNWGVSTVGSDGAKKYSTQTIVKPLRHRLELEDDLVCWLDVGGGMGAGQNLKVEMAEGVRKCTVVVVFLSDAYVNSNNCKREIEHTLSMGKYIVPVLLPDRGELPNGISSGWTGAGPEASDWWTHAHRVSRDQTHPDSGHIMSWSGLKHFVPIDMRGDGQALPRSPAELEIRRRVLSRFHRGDHIRHRTRGSYARWALLRAAVKQGHWQQPRPT